MTVSTRRAILSRWVTSPAANPCGYILTEALQDTPVVLDEVQRVPELFTALKVAVDRDRRPGRFILKSPGVVNILLSAM